jgi:preprotein translocase subunit SecF
MFNLFEVAKKMYSGNYKLLAIPPLLLIITALFFIPRIELGVEFKGGTLISLMLEKPIGQEELSAALTNEGIDAKVRVFSTATGYKAEIELPHSERLAKADEIKNKFNTQIDKVSELEYKASQNSTYMQEYIEKRRELDVLSNEMFKLAAVNKTAEKIENLNVLKKEFSTAYNDIYAAYRKEISDVLKKYVSYSSISVQSVSPLLSVHFLEKASWTVVSAVLLSIIFVFFFFRVATPSIAVLTGALSDIVIALGAMGFFGIPLTLASFAALLMLIGFSLDTDILLTMRMLKRGGDPAEKAADAMSTGVTMSISAIIAFGVLFILAYATHIPVYYEIAAVAVAGLIGDLFATWGINAVVMLWYVKSIQAKVG